MKRLNLFIAICASAALLASCTKEMQEETKRVSSVDWESIVIKGTQEGGGITKTSVDGTTGKVYWSPGDEITVFLGTAGAKYVGQNTEKAATTTFVCSSSVVIGSTEGSGDILYGLYPFDASASCDGSTITTTLPETQKAKEGTFRDSLFITVGKATVSNPTMGFYNVCGGVRFTVTTEGITSVKFKGNNNEILAGKVKISLGGGNIPVVSEVVDGKKEVTLTCAEGFKTGVMYYITTLPVALTNGYTMTFSTADLTGIQTVNSAAEIKRSVFGTRENADENVVFDGIVNIPDAKFKAYCVDNFDKNGDGEISYSEAADVDSIDVDTNEIESLEGIEKFENLRFLDCSLDFDYSRTEWVYGEGGDGYYEYHFYKTPNDWQASMYMPDLDTDREEVSGKLKNLDISKNTALATLFCGCNQIASLDISKNTALTSLSCVWNKLANLDVSKNTTLTELNCSCNPLTNLDVSNCSALVDLCCNENQLTSLDISKNTALTSLFCSMNPLTSLDVSKNIALTEFDCISTGLTSLDFSSCLALTYVRVSGNELTNLDVSNCSALTELDCGSNQLASLDVSNCSALTELYCGSNQLASLDVSNCSALTTLYCFSNQLASLDVSNCSALTKLNCYSNQLASLDVSTCSALTDLSCEYNQLTSLDVSSNTALWCLTCMSNPNLTEIWLKIGQTMGVFNYDTDVATLKYKGDGGESEPVNFENL